MKKFITFFVVVLLYCQAAEAGINSVSGSFFEGETITISGSALGTKSPAPPIDFVDFEDGIIGNDLDRSGWDSSSDIDTTHRPKITNVRAASGTKSILCNPLNAAVKSRFLYQYAVDGGGTPKLYISFNSYKDFTTHTSYFTKLFRLRSWAGGGSGLPEFFLSHLYDGKSVTAFDSTGNAACTGCGMYTVDYGFGSWEREEAYVYSGTYNTSDGTWQYWNHGEAIQTWSNNTAKFLTSTARFSEFSFGNELNVGQQHYVDNVYIDITPQRIEIGDKSDFDLCEHREIQIPVTWGPTDITFTLRLGTFQGGTAYLFVIDENGIPSDGYPVTIGGEVPPDPDPVGRTYVNKAALHNLMLH